MAPSKEVDAAVGEAPDVAARIAALREDLEGPAREQERKRVELARLEAELAAQVAADALEEATQEYTALSRAVGGLLQAYKTDEQAMREAGDAVIAALRRAFARYHDIAERLDRARHLRADHGVKGTLPLTLEQPVFVNEILKAIRDEVASFQPYKQQPSPKQQAAAAARAQIEEARHAQTAAAADLGIGQQQQRMKELAKQGVPIGSM